MPKKINMDKFKLNCANSDMNVYQFKTVEDEPKTDFPVAFRNVKVLKEIIVPFFKLYPLVGLKSYELEHWMKLVDIYYNKKHIGKEFSNKHNVLYLAGTLKQ